MRFCRLLVSALLVTLSLLVAAQAHAETAIERRMGDILYRNVEYRQYVCEGHDCPLDDFRAGIQFRTETLSRGPLAIGYFVEPRDVGTMRIIGFFVVRGTDVALQFTFLGLGMGGDPKGSTQRGFKLVIASERTSMDVWTDYFYGWDGSHYALVRTRRFVEPWAEKGE